MQNKREIRNSSLIENMAQAHSGYLGDLSSTQEAVMLEIQQWLAESRVIDVEGLRIDQHAILRFCRARKFEPEKIKTMITDFAQWRTDNNIDVLLGTWVWNQ